MSSAEREMAENTAGAHIKVPASGAPQQSALPKRGAADSAAPQGEAVSQHKSSAQAQQAGHSGIGGAVPKQTGQKPPQTAAAHVRQEHFPPFDTTHYASSLFWLAITFGFFYFFMARVVLPRLGGVLEMRRDRIAADLDQAARMKNESDAAVAAYQKNLAEAREKAKSIARNAAEEARIKAAAERRQAEAEMEKRLADAERQLGEARDKALADVHSVAEAAAADIIERLSGKKANGKLIAQAVKDSAGAAERARSAAQ